MRLESTRPVFSRRSVVFCVLAFCGLAAASQQTHPFSVRDMLAMDRISDVQISPDGRQVVFGSRAG